MPIKDRIVAEVTRNWPDPRRGEIEPLLSQDFEQVIAVNKKRGYKLESWSMSTVFVPGSDNQPLPGVLETIISVFTKESE